MTVASDIPENASSITTDNFGRYVHCVANLSSRNHCGYWQNLRVLNAFTSWPMGKAR
jgi:hypothetical protein